MKTVTKTLLYLTILFLIPALASLVWWSAVDRPGSWNTAKWHSADILPPARTVQEAVVYIMAARTGGIKGAFSEHTWIVLKRRGENQYNRYDKVGWGNPLRRNAYAADAYWYSNSPRILKAWRGPQAEALIPGIETAILSYPYRERGSYRIWPGPNSNSFIAHVLREVPELGLVLPPTAVGRDYLSDGRVFALASDWRDLTISLFGVAGISVGLRSGIEVQLGGLVTGVDFAPFGLKLPGFGRIPVFGKFQAAREAYAESPGPRD